jgi:hypothetical protein
MVDVNPSPLINAPSMNPVTPFHQQHSFPIVQPYTPPYMQSDIHPTINGYAQFVNPRPGFAVQRDALNSGAMNQTLYDRTYFEGAETIHPT